MWKFLVCALSFIILMSGCASFQEKTKCFLGVSTKILEDNRQSAIVKTVAMDYFTAYTKSADILKKSGAYIYEQGIKKHMIAVYVSETDTTPVGIFFKETNNKNTQIEVSSPSSYAKELIAGKIFSALENVNAGIP